MSMFHRPRSNNDLLLSEEVSNLRTRITDLLVTQDRILGELISIRHNLDRRYGPGPIHQAYSPYREHEERERIFNLFNNTELPEIQKEGEWDENRNRG